MIELLGTGPATFERICIAPEHPEEPSSYRKPSPAFAREIISEFAYDPMEVCYIGDRGNDLATARAEGTRGAGVSTGLEVMLAEMR
jgi:histidinol phosphatase-like enzyme